MLNMLTKKLCPLMSLALATISCGKKIAETDTQPGRQTENQELPSTFIIQLDGSQASKKQIKMSRDANFAVPDRLKVRSGNTSGKKVEISYDVNPYDGDDFDIKCLYEASANPAEMVLNKCVNFDYDDLGDVSNEEFVIYKNQIIEMKFTGANSSDMFVEAIYSMDWY